MIAFDWDPDKAASNVAKHGIPFEDAAKVFLDALNLSRPDPDAVGEERWVTIGEITGGRLAVVVHTWVKYESADIRVRLISARGATRREARQYREGS